MTPVTLWVSIDFGDGDAVGFKAGRQYEAVPAVGDEVYLAASASHEPVARRWWDERGQAHLMFTPFAAAPDATTQQRLPPTLSDELHATGFVVHKPT